MKFVVTGATGAIGRALVNKILSFGGDVTVFVNPLSKRAGGFNENVKVVKLSLEEYDGFNPDFKADFFIHLAWGKTDIFSRDDVSAQQKNVNYTLSAVRLAKRLGCRAFLGAGSQAECGVISSPITCKTAANPLSEYGKAKNAARTAAMELCESEHIRFNWARILSVYGESDTPNSLISYLINCFLKDEEPALTKCEQIWDYIYSEDCALALYLIAMRGVDGKTYPVGSGEKRTLKEYVMAVAQAAGYTKGIGFGKKEYYPHQPMYLLADIGELYRDTGFYPEYSFEKGIEKTVRYYKEKL